MSSRSFMVVAFGALCAIAGAQSLAAADTDDAPTTAPANAPIVIPKGLWTFETYSSVAAQPTGAREQIYTDTFGLGYYFMSNNSLNLELTAARAFQVGQNVTIGSYDLLLRTHLISTPDWTAFIDFGAGMLEANHRIPAGGTDFNYFFKTGVGGAVNLWDQTDLLLGARYLHISNARTDGPERNPSLNSVEGYLGLLFKL